MIGPLSLIFRGFRAKILGVPKFRHFTVVKIMKIAKLIKFCFFFDKYRTVQQFMHLIMIQSKCHNFYFLRCIMVYMVYDNDVTSKYSLTG